MLAIDEMSAGEGEMIVIVAHVSLSAPFSIVVCEYYVRILEEGKDSLY